MEKKKSRHKTPVFERVQFAVFVVSAGLVDVLLVLANVRSLRLLHGGQPHAVLRHHLPHMAVSWTVMHFAL